MSQKVDLEVLQKLLDEAKGSNRMTDGGRKNAALFVAAVNALPALLAEVRAGREAQGALRAMRGLFEVSESAVIYAWEKPASMASDEWLRSSLAQADAALASPSVPPTLIDACPECGGQDSHVHDTYGDNYPAAQETAALKEGGEARISSPATRSIYDSVSHKGMNAAHAEQPPAGPPSPALPKEEVAPPDDSPFGDDERAAYDAQIETVQSHAIREEEENARFRAALRTCLALFSSIRGDWTDPRRECRAGKAIIDAALSGETNLLRTLLDNEEQLAKESQ